LPITDTLLKLIAAADSCERQEDAFRGFISTDPGFSGRVTVPLLCNKETRRIVNNSEDNINPTAIAPASKSSLYLTP